MSNSVSSLDNALTWEEKRLILCFRHLEAKSRASLIKTMSKSLLAHEPIAHVDDLEDETVAGWLAAGYPDLAYRLIEDGGRLSADVLEAFAWQFEEAEAWREAGKCWEQAADQSLDETRCLYALRATEAFLQANDWAAAATNLNLASCEHQERYLLDEEYASIGNIVGKFNPGELYERAEDWQKAGEYYYSAHEWDKALRCFERIEKWDRCLEIAEALEDHELLFRYSKLSGNLTIEAECLEEVGKFEDAASCYARDQLWDNALTALACAWLDYRTNDALALLNITQSWERLADYYRRQENWELAGTNYELSGDLRQAADCFEKANHWQDAGRCLEAIASSSSRQLSLFPDVALQQQVDLLKRAAAAYLKADEFELAKRCLERIELT